MSFETIRQESNLVTTNSNESDTLKNLRLIFSIFRKTDVKFVKRFYNEHKPRPHNKLSSKNILN